MRNKQRFFVALFLLVVLGMILFTYFYTNSKENARSIENTNWSQQGDWIVFSCTTNDAFIESSLYLVRPDGTEVQRLTTNNIVARYPSWSPTGEEIVFSGVVENTEGIYKLVKGKNKPTTISQSEQSVSENYPVWSPDGKWIAVFLEPLTNSSELILINSTTDSRVHVVGGQMPGRISWSSDAQWIAYSVFEDSNDDWGIYKIRVDGTEKQLIVNGVYAQPTWSPVGEQIAFEHDGIHIVQADGSQVNRIVNLSNPVGPPTWSPDGEWLVFSYRINTSSQLHKVRVDGSELQQITNLDCNAQNPDWIRMPGSDQ